MAKKRKRSVVGREESLRRADPRGEKGKKVCRGKSGKSEAGIPKRGKGEKGLSREEKKD